MLTPAGPLAGPLNTGHIPTLCNLTMSYQELGLLVIGCAFESIYMAEECYVFYHSLFLFTYLFAFEINDR